MLRDLFSLFPAYAGVIPCRKVFDLLFLPFPRIRGGDPGWNEKVQQWETFSPHTRG